MAQAPRRIGATSAAPAIAAGRLAAANTLLRRRARRSSASDDRGDHALIGLARVVAKGEDAVLQQHQPLDRGIGLEDLGRRLGEQEARHDVGHEPHPPAVEIGAALGRVGLVGEAQHRGRMGVVDEFMRQKGVQQGLDRRVGRAGIEQIGALDPHHLLVRQGLAEPQFAAAARAAPPAARPARSPPCPSRCP